MTDRTVKVTLLARIEQWTRAMNDAGKDVSKVGAATEKSSAKADKALKNVGKSAQTNGKAMALGLTAAAYGAYKLVQSASDLNETQNKMGVVFKGSSSAVAKWASTAAESMGLSTRAAEESAATFGNLFETMGITGKKSADMSEQIVKLGSDLASFNNTDPASAIEALRSGLTGQSDALKAYGVNINDAGVKTKAFELGLYSGKGALDASARAQATYALILAQTGNAQGDFARTSDSVANSQRIAAAEFENTKAAIGQQLLPAYNSILKAGTNVLKFFNGLPGPVQTSVLALGGLAVVAKVVGPAMLSMRTSILEARVAQAALATSTVTATGALEAEGVVAAASGGKWTGMAKGIGKAALALAAVSAIGHGINAATGGGLDATTTSVDDLTKSADELDVRFSLAFSQFADNGVKVTNALGGILPSIVGAKSAADAAGESFAKYDQTMADLVGQGNLKGAADLWQKLTDVGKSHGATTEQLTALFPQYTSALNTNADALSQNAALVQLGISAKMAEQIAYTRSTMYTKAQTDAYKLQIPTLDELYGKVESAALARGKLSDAEASAVGIAKDVKDGNKSVAQGLSDYIGIANAAKDATANASDKDAAYRAELGKLRDHLAKGSPLRKTLDDYIARLDAAAGVRTAEIRLKVLATLAIDGELHGMSKAIVSAASQKATVVAGSSSQAGGKGHAKGGLLVGPGTSTSDSIPWKGSRGEFIVTAATTQRVGVGNLMAANAGGNLTRAASAPTSTMDMGAMLTAARALVAAADRIQGPPPVFIAGQQVATAVRDQNQRDIRRG